MSVDKLNDAKNYIETWLERSREIISVVPEVKRLQELVNWELRTYENRPTDVSSGSAPNLNEHARVLYDQVTSALPRLPSLNSQALARVNSISASTSSAVASYVSTVFASQTPEGIAFASNAMSEFQALVERRQRPLEVRNLLEARMPAVLSRFDAAERACEQCKSGLIEQSAAALEMRTFLDAVKGELISRARTHQGENMKFELAAARLFASVSEKDQIQEQVDGWTAHGTPTQLSAKSIQKQR